MDGRMIYIMAGAPRAGKDSVIEFMTKYVFQGIDDVKNSMVLSYSFIDDSRARADLIGIPAEKTPEFRKFLSDDADTLDNFDPEGRGYGYRVYRFIHWMEKNVDPRTACIMVNLRQMKGIVPMTKAVEEIGYRVRILKVTGRGLTEEEMSNEGDKEFLYWPPETFYYTFDNSSDLDFLEDQVRRFVEFERDDLQRENETRWNKVVEGIEMAEKDGTLQTEINIQIPEIKRPTDHKFTARIYGEEPMKLSSVIFPTGAGGSHGVSTGQPIPVADDDGVIVTTPGGFNSAEDFSLPAPGEGQPLESGNLPIPAGESYLPGADYQFIGYREAEHKKED